MNLLDKISSKEFLKKVKLFAATQKELTPEQFEEWHKKEKKMMKELNEQFEREHKMLIPTEESMRKRFDI
jgi:predicted HAD superfamily Cof-like phosphohydrolase